MRTMGQFWEAACELAPEEADRIPWLRRRLLAWFLRSGRSFPWREPDRAPYEVVVAEILLQRTTAAGVARAYPGFVDRYPSWASLAQASPEELENALRPLGLWRQKALAFQQLALAIEGRGGVVPRTRKELEGLPGIGPWAALDFGALVCRARNPLCPGCPLRSRCQYARPPGFQLTPSASVLSSSRNAGGR